MYFLHVLLILVFYNSHIVAGGAKDLLKITSGSGVSFIDLWNLKGKTVGKLADTVYRNGLIDLSFSAGCPSKIYFQLKKGSKVIFGIIYKASNFASASLSAWIVRTPFSVQHSLERKQITLKLRPQNGIDFWIKSSNTDIYYETISFDRSKNTGPIFYHSADADGYDGPFSGINDADYLLVRASYNGYCPTTAPAGNVQITADQMKNELYPIQGPVVTTYFPQVTTADESSTESVDMTTSLTGEKTKTSTFAADQSTMEKIEVSTPKIDTSPNDMTEVSTFVADQSTPEKTGISTPTPDISSTDTTTVLDVSSSKEITSQVSQSSVKVTTDETAKMCPCSCEFKARLDMLNTRSNLSLEELRKQMQPELDEIKRRYTWDKTKTSAFKRKKISAADKRKSSEQIGIVAGSFIAVVIALVIVIDVVAIKRHVGVFRRHFWGEESSPDEEVELVDTHKKKSKMKKEKELKTKQ